MIRDGSAVPYKKEVRRRCDETGLLSLQSINKETGRQADELSPLLAGVRESEKTSIRIRNKMQQMMLEGLYTGGPIRFGYHLVDSDLVNRKGAKIRKYEIDPMESELLRMIDDMTGHKGYGSYRMAGFLNKNGYTPNGGGKFTSIKGIEVGRGYQIRAELNMTYKQFCSEWGGSDLFDEEIG